MVFGHALISRYVIVDEFKNVCLVVKKPNCPVVQALANPNTFSAGKLVLVIVLDVSHLMPLVF
jgi:hypothetical protein